MMYLMESKYNVAFCESVEKLYYALKYRLSREAIIVSSDNWEDLRHLAGICRQRLCDINIDNNNPVPQIAIPNTISETMCLQSTASTVSETMCLQSTENTVSETMCLQSTENTQALTTANAYSDGGWAISALNGFCTADCDEMLCKLFASNELQYPMAKWTNDHNSAVIVARNDYVRRFYSRYWYNAEQTFLPQYWLEFFRDPYFEEREQRLPWQSRECYEFQLRRLTMGW